MFKILVVEDDKNNQEVLFDILSYHGLQMATTESGEEALSYIQNEAFDAIIIDLQLPGMDGWQLFDEIHAMTSLPCIAMTVYDNKEVEDTAYRVGFVGYFPKPVDPLTFGEQLIDLLS